MQPRKFLKALEAVLYIALHSGVKAVNSREVAEQQGVQSRYLEQILQTLVKAGVLRGSRGPRGGYMLAKERRRQTVGEIYLLIERAEAKKMKEENSELHESVVLPLWKETEATIIEALNDVTIEDLCKKQSATVTEKQKTDFAI